MAQGKRLLFAFTDLRSKAASFWDLPRKEQTADVVAHKVDCQKP
jgi:hypothetical protein